MDLAVGGDDASGPLGGRKHEATATGMAGEEGGFAMTVSSCRPLPWLVAMASPHPLGNVLDGVHDTLRVSDRQLFTEIQLLDECVGRHLYALLVASGDTSHHDRVLLSSRVSPTGHGAPQPDLIVKPRTLSG
jgi:hypothetical protein